MCLCLCVSVCLCVCVCVVCVCVCIYACLCGGGGGGGGGGVGCVRVCSADVADNERRQPGPDDQYTGCDICWLVFSSRQQGTRFHRYHTSPHPPTPPHHLAPHLPPPPSPSLPTPFSLQLLLTTTTTTATTTTTTTTTTFTHRRGFVPHSSWSPAVAADLHGNFVLITARVVRSVFTPLGIGSTRCTGPTWQRPQRTPGTSPPTPTTAPQIVPDTSLSPPPTPHFHFYSVSLSVCLSLFLSVSVRPSVCLSVCLSLSLHFFCLFVFCSLVA